MDFFNAFGAGLLGAFAIDGAEKRQWNYCAFCLLGMVINVIAYFI